MVYWFCIHLAIPISRVGFLPEEMYFFQDARKKLENSYFFQFLPEETGWNGRNWKKLKYPKTLKICLVSNITSTHISVFIKDGINLFTDSTFQFPHQPNVKDAAISELWAGLGSSTFGSTWVKYKYFSNLQIQVQVQVLTVLGWHQVHQVLFKSSTSTKYIGNKQ